MNQVWKSDRLLVLNHPTPGASLTMITEHSCFEHDIFTLPCTMYTELIFASHRLNCLRCSVKPQRSRTKVISRMQGKVYQNLTITVWLHIFKMYLKHTLIHVLWMSCYLEIYYQIKGNDVNNGKVFVDKLDWMSLQTAFMW